jgi:hypothetical protein
LEDVDEYDGELLHSLRLLEDDAQLKHAAEAECDYEVDERNEGGKTVKLYTSCTRSFLLGASGFLLKVERMCGCACRVELYDYFFTTSSLLIVLVFIISVNSMALELEYFSLLMWRR